ncbi:response regulator [Thiohalocapsa marina]|uniref:histidine kinase n=1 Tax=Thiohalocapsa marina TaxID=424902 RepID=A0A5M8FVC1_9GAMM|nr:ATP-binding protein [Thiohalocapsa marina]KAA6187762.1 response regulator [Thiohalocapsa marina]
MNTQARDAPGSAPASAASPQASAQAAVDVAPARILVIDDAPTNIEILLGMLEGDYEMSFATSGPDALDLLGHIAPPDLILLDIMMPEMDGYAVCKALKQNPATRDIPVIFVTAKTDAESEIRALNLGGVDFIHKPINRGMVRARIALHLELTRHRRHLQELVIARTRELALARDAAESASRAKTALLANVGHELRTPLNHIVGETYLLRRDHADPRIGRSVGVIEQSSRQLLMLIDNILELARVESGALQLKPEAFDLEGLLVPLETRFAALAQQKGLGFARELDPRLPPRLRGDAGCLGQVLTQLLENAVKFSEQGTIRLSLRREAMRSGSMMVRFAVTDQGIGLLPEQQAAAFEDFRQGDTSLARQQGGTGLGLALCRRLTALMGGEIGVDSILGQGSCFWFCVPLELIPATTMPPSPEPVDAQRLQQVMAPLAVRLAVDDMEAQQLYADAAALLDPVLGTRRQDFAACLAAFDFERALALLREAAAAHSPPVPLE